MTIEEEEAAAEATLMPRIREHIDYLSRVFDLFEATHQSFGNRQIDDIPLPARVALILTSRIASDLRSIVLLSRKGYGAQACGIGATVFELAYEALRALEGEAAARHWFDNRAQSSTKATKRLHQYFRAIGVDDPNALFNIEKAVYDSLNKMKHGHPTSLAIEVREVDTDTVEVEVILGPDVTHSGESAIRYAIEQSGRLASNVAYRLVQKYGAPSNRDGLLHLLRQSKDVGARLQQQSLNRYADRLA